MLFSHIPLHVMIQALAKLLAQCGLYTRFRALAADHLRQGYSPYDIDVLAVFTRPLEWQVLPTVCPHQHDRGSFAFLRSGTGEVLRHSCTLFLGQLFDLSQCLALAVDNRRFQRVCSPVRLG